MRSAYLAGFCLLGFIQSTIALELQEIRPSFGTRNGRQFGKRVDSSALDLRSTESFLWGGAGESIIV